MQKVKDDKIEKLRGSQLFDPVLFKKRLLEELKNFCIMYNINDLKTITPPNFKAFLSDAHDRLINDKTTLRKPNSLNYYDVDVIYDHCIDIYVYVCNICSVVITINGFCDLYGIDYWAMNTWQSYKVTDTHFKLYKKLYTLNEESIQDNSGNKKYNYVILMAQLNRWHHWATAASAQGNTSPNSALGSKELPNLPQIAVSGIADNNIID